MAWSRIWIDLSMLSYAVSLVLLFIDVIQPRRIVNRTALLLLFVVFSFETLLLFARLEQSGTVPVYTRSDVMVLVSWLILLVALVVNAFFRIDLVLFFANLLGFGIVSFSVFAPSVAGRAAGSEGDLLVLHVAFAILSYVAFSFAFVFSAMYLIQDHFLKRKQWNRLYFRLPSLERLDTYTFRAILLGFPFLLLSMVLGVLWGELRLHRLVILDPKPLATTLLWLMYGVYLILRSRVGWGGPQLVWFNVFCFVGVLVNFAVVSDFSLFHHLW